MSDSEVTLVQTDQAKRVCEGKAKVLLPSTVFYNPVQEFNRDLTIAVISTSALDIHTLTSEKDNSGKRVSKRTAKEDNKRLADDRSSSTDSIDTTNKIDDILTLTPGQRYDGGIRILEALAASGLRSIRFALEIPGVKEIVANDFDKTAVDYIKRNAALNNVVDLVRPNYADATMLMYESRRIVDQFDVVDLDPYGSPTTFLDAAVQSVRDGGLLCVTCTDMAVLCGNATETCHAKYGSISLKSKFCHEMAIRILLRSIESHANRYSRFILPLLSISIDFYCRTFVRIYTGQQKVKDSAAKLSMIYQCNCCSTFTLQPLTTKLPTKNDKFKYVVSTGPPVDSRCKHCNGRHVVGGPIWSAEIHDRCFVQKMIADVENDDVNRFGTRQRIIGILNVIAEELENQPLYYDTDHLCTVLHCSAIGFIPMRSALLHAGYKVSLSHANKKSLKTNASSDVIWDILRCWVKKNPVSSQRLQPGSIAEKILNKEPSFEADFSPHPSANPESRKKGLVRWQLNPEKDWGPKSRAARNQDTAQVKKKEQKQKSLERKAKRKADFEEVLRTSSKSYPCKKFKKGICDLGDACCYSHDENCDRSLSIKTKEEESTTETASG